MSYGVDNWLSVVTEPQDLFARRLAVELGADWQYTKTTVVVEVSEALSAEVSLCLDGDIRVGLSGLSNEYRRFEDGPDGAKLAASFIRETLTHERTA